MSTFEGVWELELGSKVDVTTFVCMFYGTCILGIFGPIRRSDSFEGGGVTFILFAGPKRTPSRQSLASRLRFFVRREF